MNPKADDHSFRERNGYEAGVWCITLKLCAQPDNTVLFVGFQAAGTGAAMLDGADAIKIHGEYVPVRARVELISNLSAHADYSEILNWLRGFEKPPRKTFITHGEPVAADMMRLHIEEQLHWPVEVPDYLETVELS